MKNLVIALVLTNMFLFVGCQTQNHMNEINTTKTGQTSTINGENEVMEIAVDSVDGLTSDDAIELCRAVVGERDDESFMLQMGEVHTSRDIGYRCDGAVECSGKQYYVVCMLWSDEEDYWSTIGYLGVLADGSEIHEVINHSNGTYSFVKLLWNK